MPTATSSTPARSPPTWRRRKPDALTVDWSPYLAGKLSDPVDTTVPRKSLDTLAAQINTIPDAVKLHPRVAKIYEDRRKMAAGELPADWGFAENLAYATLLDEGYRLRLVGQDCGRGTFFHRHAILHDQKTDALLPAAARNWCRTRKTSPSSTRCSARKR